MNTTEQKGPTMTKLTARPTCGDCGRFIAPDGPCEACDDGGPVFHDDSPTVGGPGFDDAGYGS